MEGSHTAIVLTALLSTLRQESATRCCSPVRGGGQKEDWAQIDWIGAITPINEAAFEVGEGGGGGEGGRKGGEEDGWRGGWRALMGKRLLGSVIVAGVYYLTKKSSQRKGETTSISFVWF